MTAVIVVPCFNEAERWSMDYWREMLSLPGVRWLFVNDGSTDGTLPLLMETARLGSAEVLDLNPNGGKAEAVRRGLLQAVKGSELNEAVGFMDADGAFNPADVADLLTSYRAHTTSPEEFDAVWSSRVALAGRDIRRSTSRHYIGRVVATFVSMGQTDMPYDTQSGLKLFRSSTTLRGCLEVPFQTRWLFELELIARWKSLAPSPMRIWEEPLNYWHDIPGSKITSRESRRILRELIVLKSIQRASK